MGGLLLDKWGQGHRKRYLLASQIFVIQLPIAKVDRGSLILALFLRLSFPKFCPDALIYGPREEVELELPQCFHLRLIRCLVMLNYLHIFELVFAGNEGQLEPGRLLTQVLDLLKDDSLEHVAFSLYPGADSAECFVRETEFFPISNCGVFLQSERADVACFKLREEIKHPIVAIILRTHLYDEVVAGDVGGYRMQVEVFA